MFFTYLRRELRRRARQSSVIVIGLGVGVGLVITVSALSSGVKDAQANVLHSLYGVGTDVTVTKSPTAGSGGPGSFGFHGQTGTQQRPAAGTTIHVDNLAAVGRGVIAQRSVTAVARLGGVSRAAASLSLTDTKITGRIPAINPSQGSTSGSPPTGQGGEQNGQAGSGFRGSFAPSSFTVDGVQLTGGALGPLSTGSLTSGRTLRAADAGHDVAVVDSDYARQEKLKAGSTLTIAKHTFQVVGIVSIPASTSGSDVFIPLDRAQALSHLEGKVTSLYVAATSSTRIGSVSREISGLLPSSTVTDSSNLADQVSGSVASASSLANRLGRWLAIAVLIAAFLLASLLTMAAVSRRVRELGTLKALGWRSRRVVGQVVGESVTLGVVGGAVGVALGLFGAWIVTLVAPELSATVGASSGSGTPGGPQFSSGPAGGGSALGGGPPAFGSGSGAGGSSNQVVFVHLSAPVTFTVVAVAVLLAVLGGLLAGTVGGWRAARLRPAAAMTKVS